MQEEALFDEMKEIQAAVQPDNIVFVMDATQGQSASSPHSLPAPGCRPTPITRGARIG